jgi:hypothetical protein
MNSMLYDPFPTYCHRTSKSLATMPEAGAPPEQAEQTEPTQQEVLTLWNHTHPTLVVQFRITRAKERRKKI